MHRLCVPCLHETLRGYFIFMLGACVLISTHELLHYSGESFLTAQLPAAAVEFWFV